jgi:hypothetical protein
MFTLGDNVHNMVRHDAPEWRNSGGLCREISTLQKCAVGRMSNLSWGFLGHYSKLDKGSVIWTKF